MCLYLNDKLSGLMTGGSWQPADASPPTIYKKKFKVQIIGPLLKGIYAFYIREDIRGGAGDACATP